MLTADEYAALKRQLTSNESRKSYLYDDATGQRITQGTTVVGHPTWGIGFNTDATDFSDAAIDAQFEDVLTRRINAVVTALPWVETLPSGPMRAIIDVGYNTGIDGLLGFHKMLDAAVKGDYRRAAIELINSKLPPGRAKRLSVLMQS